MVTEGIDRIEPRGVITADGRLHELDVLVLATGFDARAYMRPIRIIGADGRSLDEVWDDGPYAYRSVAVPGFPNLLMLMGPHSPIANQSLVPVAEDQADYALWWIKQMRDGRVDSFAPTEAATKLYNSEIELALPADDLGERVQQLVSREERTSRGVSLEPGPPPRTASQPRGGRLRGAQLLTAVAFPPDGSPGRATMRDGTSADVAYQGADGASDRGGLAVGRARCGTARATARRAAGRA